MRPRCPPDRAPELHRGADDLDQRPVDDDLGLDQRFVDDDLGLDQRPELYVVDDDLDLDQRPVDDDLGLDQRTMDDLGLPQRLQDAPGETGCAGVTTMDGRHMVIAS